MKILHLCKYDMFKKIQNNQRTIFISYFFVCMYVCMPGKMPNQSATSSSTNSFCVHEFPAELVGCPATQVKPSNKQLKQDWSTLYFIAGCFGKKQMRGPSVLSAAQSIFFQKPLKRAGSEHRARITWCSPELNKRTPSTLAEGPVHFIFNPFSWLAAIVSCLYLIFSFFLN